MAGRGFFVSWPSLLFFAVVEGCCVLLHEFGSEGILLLLLLQLQKGLLDRVSTTCEIEGVALYLESKVVVMSG